jgi:hypothetical protein
MYSIHVHTLLVLTFIFLIANASVSVYCICKVYLTRHWPLYKSITSTRKHFNPHISTGLSSFETHLQNSSLYHLHQPLHLKRFLKVTYANLVTATFDVDMPCTWTLVRDCPCHRSSVVLIDGSPYCVH